MRSALAAFLGLPRFRFCPMGTFLAAGGAWAYFWRNATPMICLHLKVFWYFGNVQLPFDKEDLSNKIVQQAKFSFVLATKETRGESVFSVVYLCVVYRYNWRGVGRISYHPGWGWRRTSTAWSIGAHFYTFCQLTSAMVMIHRVVDLRLKSSKLVQFTIERSLDFGIWLWACHFQDRCTL